MKTQGNNKLFLGGLSIILFLLFYTFFSERGLLKSRQLTGERDAIITQAKTLAVENRHLTEVNKALKTDLKTIERAARSTLDLVKENEILYKFAE